MRRFAIAPERLVDGRVTFDAAETRHLARVLRLQPGDTVVASDGAGHDYTVRLDTLSPRARGTVVGTPVAVAVSPLEVTLVQAIPKGDKLEAIVRAATELGVTRVQPALSERTVVRLAGRAAEARRERWQRVAREASKQCGRATVPDVAAPRELGGCLDLAREHDLALCCWEGEAAALATALARVERARRVALLVGPEGGLTAREVEAARGRGWEIVSLGPRILRTETAGPAVLAVLQARWGDLAASQK
jgi:16S rRNA (uracil1498-N3)-methyltransferase